MDFFMSVKDTLRQFRSPPRVAYDLPYVSPRDAPTSNMPLGKSVWLMGSKKEVGSITHTFDCPSNSRPYPSGYQHDLSLITKTDGDADDLSLLGSTSGLPLVDGWANIQEALDGAPLFVASTVAYTNDTTISHGTLTGKQAQDDLHAHVQQAIAEGTQYTWDPETLAQSVSLLWRCVPPPSELLKATPEATKALMDVFRGVAGQSGSLICLGRPTDDTTKALLFQNFELTGETGLPHSLVRNVKGGFLLPSYIYDKCQIHHGRVGLEQTAGRFATVPRDRKLSDARQRSFSSPV